MADPVLTAALNDLKAAIASAQETLTATDRNHFARQLGNLKKQVSAPARELAEHEWAAVTAVLKAETDRSQELQDRIEAARILKNLDAESAEAARAKAKRKRTARDLLLPDGGDSERL